MSKTSDALRGQIHNPADSQAPSGAQGTIDVRAEPGQIRITLLDGQFNWLAEGVGRLKQLVPVGLYELRFDTGLDNYRKLITVRPDPELKPGLDPPPPLVVKVPFDSAAPLPETNGYIPGQGEAASQLSREPLALIGRGTAGALLLFAADLGTPLPTDHPWEPLLQTVNLHDSTGTQVPLPADVMRIFPAARCAGWCVSLDAGSYSLRWLPADPGKASRSAPVDQPIWVSPGWVTMVFVRTALVDHRKRLDRGRLIVHQGRIGFGFDPFDTHARPVQWATELALTGWQGRTKYLSDDSSELDVLLNEKHINPILGVVAAHSLWLAGQPNLSLLSRIQHSLESVIPDHPDVIVLGAMARYRGVTGLPDRSRDVRLHYPPMFAASYRAAVALDWEGVLLFASDSPATKLAPTLLQCSVWTWLADVVPTTPAAESEDDDTRDEVLGAWLAGALQVIPALHDLIASLGWGPHVKSNRDLWRLFASTSHPVILRLIAQAEQLYELAVSAKRPEELSTLSLPELCRGLNLPRSAINDMVTRALHTNWSQQEVITPDWPPVDGRSYVKSEAFGKLLVDEVEVLARSNRQMDFVDATAHLFIWLDGKLRKNRRFLNKRRFPTVQSFRAYLRQAAKNAALREHRYRAAQRPLRGAESATDLALDPAQLAALRESIDTLAEPYKTVLERIFFQHEDVDSIARILNLTSGQIERLYGEAIDKLPMH